MLVKINQFSIRQQCDLLDVNRSGLYSHPVPESAENLLYTRLLDEQYTEDPTYGVERMTAHLQRLGYRVNPKRVRRLLRTMGLDANGAGCK
jgi:putative transposase